MQALMLQNSLGLFNSLINPSALSACYRALSLSSSLVRGCAVFGAMEVEVDTGLQSQIVVDGESFLQVLRSLPAGEFKMEVTSSGLLWSCGSAKGKLGLLGEDVQVTPVVIPDGVKFMDVAAQFGRGLELGSLACGSSALMSFGLYGVSIATSSGVRAYSSDDNIIASAKMDEALTGLPVTLSPQSARLLSSLTSTGKASVGLDDSTVYCATPTTKLVLKQIPPLKYPISDQLAGFLAEESKVPLKRDIITAFIRRAEALTEEKKKTDVVISVTDGAVLLSFEDGKSSSEEYYLAESGSNITVDPITIDSRRLSRALGHSSRIVFDHIERGALVLRGDNEFVFVIAGKAPQ